MPGKTAEVVREGRHVALEALVPAHYPALHRLITSRPQATLWRSRGRWIAPSQLERFLSEGVFFSTVATDRDRPTIRGIVELLNVDREADHGELSLFWPEPDGFALEALTLFCDEVFHRFGLQRVFAFLSETAVSLLGVTRLSAVRPCGVLPEYVRINGRSEDIHVLEVAVDRFAEVVSSRHGGTWPWAAGACAVADGVASRHDVVSLACAHARRDCVGEDESLWEMLSDSLARIEFVLDVEAMIGRELPEEFWRSVRTLGDLLRALAE